MNLPEISVTYERKLSDGAYGSEGLSLTWTGSVQPDDPLVIAARYAQIASALRTTLLTELTKSSAYTVAAAARRELNPPPPRQPVAAGGSPEDMEDIPF